MRYPDFASCRESGACNFAVSDERIEGVVDAAIEAGVSLSIMSMLYLDE